MIKRFLPLLIILFSIFLFFLFSLMKKGPAMRDEVNNSILVEVTDIDPKTDFITLKAYGTVKPLYSYNLTSQVKGEVINHYPNLKIGTKIKEGELIFAVDAREYKYIVEEKKAILQKAIFEMKEEEGRQIVAKKEWDFLNKDFKGNDLSKSLALRQHYLEENKANVNAAENSLKRAKLDIEKTKVFAPCDGIIISESIELKQFLKANSKVGEFVCSNVFKVVALIPQSKRKFFIPIDEVIPNSKAQIKGYDAKVIKLLPYIDSNSKMLQLLIEIEKPLERKDPIMLEEFVEVSLKTKKVKNIYRVPNKSLQHNDIIMLVNKEGINIKLSKFEIIAREKETTLISFQEDISGNIKVITSYVAFPYEGMPIIIKSDKK